jgi:hypothetical protein
MFLHEKKVENMEEELGSWRNHGGRILECIWRRILKSPVFNP